MLSVLLSIVLIALVALVGSFATFFSGFGLGTILLPVFALFFPLDIAILSTALVHFFNNIFKFGLVYNHLDWRLILRFGIPSGIGAWLGSSVLAEIGKADLFFSYTLFDKFIEVNWTHFIIGILMIFFALMDLLPFLDKITFGKKAMLIGGLISGFFGGLSGHQGALRSAFLSKAELSKQVFVSTGITISFIVDLIRMGNYLKGGIEWSDLPKNGMLIGVLSAFLGAYFGKKLFDKKEIPNIRIIVSIFLFVMGLFTMIGLT
jgi:uncharacterized protein